MKKLKLFVLAMCASLVSSVVMAETKMGISAAMTTLSTSGSETLRESGNVTNKSIDEDLTVPSLFIEAVLDNGFAVGVDYVPVAELGSGTGDDDDAEGSEEAVKDKVMDLENALDELKAEFDAMMGDDDKGDDEEADAPEMPEMPGEEVEMEADATEEEAVEETADEEVEEGESKTAEQLINEYSDMVKADMSNGEESSKSPVAAKGGTEPSANASDLMDTKEAGAVKSADKPKDMGVDAKNKPGIKKAKMDNAPKPTTADTPDNKTSVTPK